MMTKENNETLEKSTDTETDEQLDISTETPMDDDVEIIEEEAVKVEVEEEEPLRIQLMRLQADFDNFRKRQVRERAEWITRANEDLILETLPVLDHFEMGLKSAEEHEADNSVIDGFKLVYNQQKLSIIRGQNQF